ncbi:GNAT family N-acetyltransferase [Enterobacter sp. RHBSTW-00994]|uniref:GNAT family N-acetyltransferase n=1 Tax=Enterobacteriaceae TaxID=543 RepID=UPI0015E93F79|nr:MULTISPECIES: GNAT family N-acetyltransferase [Enterobacteriaceae]MBM3073140.1 GNAT family N-acetyltransferase [Lelliottia sp. RWM.1]QLR41707.1 GNAT family N-acetyltransferase [Enterobacter sp. RHBSTW-00994]
MKITYRPATQADITSLPAIEHSAGQRFRDLPALAWLADSPGISVEQHQLFAEQEMSWVALADGQPVGFVLADAHALSLFIVELSVHLEWQGKGIGRQLLACVAEKARMQKRASLTLTTFRDVPWNAPFYMRLGFAMVSDEELPAELRQKREEETAHGLTYGSRCAMRLMLTSRPA